MTEYICKEVQTDNGGYLEPVKELIRCRDCQAWKGKECNLPEHGWCGCLQQLTHAGDYCAWSPNLDEDEEC